jgi:hypothetical protein
MTRPLSSREAIVEEHGVNSSAVADVLARAARLDASEINRLADAVGWNWWPLTVPPGGAIASAWATAAATAHRTGRDGQLAAATEAGRVAVRASAGYAAAGRRGSLTELGLALLVGGVGGLFLLWYLGRADLAWLGLFVALVALVVIAFAERGRVARGRVLRAVEGAVTAAVLQDVLDPDAYTTLSAPWRGALHD